MAGLDRSVFIALLNRLGGNDEEALAAARELHSAIADSGVTWDDLLIPDTRPASTPDPAGGITGTAEDEARGDTDPDEEDEADETGEEPPEDEEDEEEDGEDDEEEEAAAEDVVPEEPRAASPGEDARIVERLLARKGLSQETRDELAGFRSDIAEGRLSAMDSRYIRALARRLGA